MRQWWNIDIWGKVENIAVNKIESVGIRRAVKICSNWATFSCYCITIDSLNVETFWQHWQHLWF